MLTFIFTGHSKIYSYFMAKIIYIYSLLIPEIANLYVTSIVLLFNRITCTGRQTIALINPVFHLIYIDYNSCRVLQLVTDTTMLSS